MTGQAVQPASGAHIDRRLVVPYYRQLRDILARRMDSEWVPGGRLPSESEICRAYGVSRTVVRQALDDLDGEGLLFRVKGKGTFITQRKVNATFVQQPVGFHASMTAQGYTVGSHVLALGAAKATPLLAKLLDLAIGAPVVQLDRVRTLDELPIQVERTYLPHRLVPGFETIDMENRSLYATLEERYGIRPTSWNRTFEVVPMSRGDADRLGVKPGSPALSMSSLSRTADGVAVEYDLAVYRGDRARFEITFVSQ
jgi:GntR family transcriptional regulator